MLLFVTGRELVFYTQPSNLNPHGAMWLSVLDKSSSTFHVSSCEAVTVALSRYLGNYLSGYVVILGERDGTLSRIVRMNDSTIIAEVCGHAHK